MNNHNKLLFRLAVADGLKTGYYRETGFNVVATASKNDLRLIVVVLGKPQGQDQGWCGLGEVQKGLCPI